MPVELIEDVLHRILELCSPSTLAVLSRVSSSFRSLAFPHLMHTVRLKIGSRQVAGFSNFLINNESDLESPISRPGKHVFDLELRQVDFFNEYSICFDVDYHSTESDSISTWFPLLVQALELMPNLRFFALESFTELGVSHSPHFARTLLGLPQLKSLTIGGIGPDALASFEQAVQSGALTDDTRQPTLQKLVIDGFVHSIVDSPILHPNTGLGRVISHKRMHLTELDLCMLDPMPLFNNIIFPHVVQIKITDCDLSLRAVATAFPALRSFHLHSSGTMVRFPYFKLPRIGTRVFFPHLESIQGCSGNICTILNFSTSRVGVRRVVIFPSIGRDNDISPFPILSNSPSLKSLHFSQAKPEPSSWWKDFAETVPNLIYLRVQVASSSVDDRDLIVNRLPTVLAVVPLVYLSLVIKQQLEFSDTFTEQDIALSFTKAIPTLKYIDIVNRHCNGVERAPETWWEAIAKAGDTPLLRVKRIDAKEGKALRDYYDNGQGDAK